MDLKDVPTLDLFDELRRRGNVVIMWTVDDMDGFGDERMPNDVKLDMCAKALEDRSVERGWEVIESILGYEKEIN